MIDLSLVPLTDLIDEIDRRVPQFVLGYVTYDSGQEIFNTHWNCDRNYLKSLGLAQQVVFDIQNSIYERE